MIEISLEELKARQLEILTRIDKFCTEHNIQYSLAFGTLLGAIRHKGYIPWDDDIDIMMLRSEYNRFISLFYDDQLRVLTIENEPRYILPFAKVVDNNSILIEQTTMKLPLGINVDVFPVDNIPDDKSVRKEFYRNKKILNYLLDTKILTYSSERSIWKNLLLGAAKFLIFFLNTSNLTKTISEYSQKYSGLMCNDVAVFAPTDNKKRWIVNRSIFKEYIRVTFEGQTFTCIKEWDNYLKATYGSYMRLPPIEQRVTHHSFKAYKK